MDKIESKLGFFGDPAVIGVVVGVLLGIITKQDIGTTLSIGMGVSAVIDLNPKNGNSYDGRSYSFRKCCKCLYEE